MYMYQLLKQGNELPGNTQNASGNSTRFSLYNDLCTPVAFSGFSIKFVLEGHENYQINGNSYQVSNHEYILANQYCEGKINIDSRQMVKGLCIDISPQLLSQVFANYVAPDSTLPDYGPENFFLSEAFLENKYSAPNTGLGLMLMQFAAQLNKAPFYNHQVNNELYYSLAEKIVVDHAQIISQLYKLRTVKHKTRKDLYRKLTKGKEFLDNHLDRSINIQEAAEYAMLSEYHFFRLFKTAFGITPHQYLLNLRLVKARDLLASGDYSISGVSFACGFSDIHHFSNAFKRQFGYAPSWEGEGRRVGGD